MFRFAQPEYLYLLIIVPILWGLFIYGRYRSRRNLAKVRQSVGAGSFDDRCLKI